MKYHSITRLNVQVYLIQIVLCLVLVSIYSVNSFQMPNQYRYRHSNPMDMLVSKSIPASFIANTQSSSQSSSFSYYPNTQVSPLKRSSTTSTSLQPTTSTITTIPDLPPKPKKVEPVPPLTLNEKVLVLLKENWLVLGEVLVIYVAKTNPALGATGGPLKPEFFISKLGVFTIFFINGIALNLEKDSSSDAEVSTQMRTNVLIQLFSFVFFPTLMKTLAPFYPVPEFRDGLVVLSCIPVTINICVAQTLAAGGNMATVIFNAVFANVIGVFLTPLLSVMLLGTDKGVSLLDTLFKLGGVVIVPLALGQLLKPTPIGTFFEKIRKYSRTLSSCLLLAIVYNIFSDTFLQGIGVAGKSLGILMVSMPVLYLSLSLLFWEISKRFLPGLDPATRTAALFCAPQKTLAFGIPFIKTAFGTRPDLAYVLAPLLMYAPTQLLLGSTILVPLMRSLIQKSQSFNEGGGI